MSYDSHLKAVVAHGLHPVLTGLGKNALEWIYNLLFHHVNILFVTSLWNNIHSSSSRSCPFRLECDQTCLQNSFSWSQFFKLIHLLITLLLTLSHFSRYILNEEHPHTSVSHFPIWWAIFSSIFIFNLSYSFCYPFCFQSLPNSVFFCFTLQMYGGLGFRQGICG